MFMPSGMLYNFKSVPLLKVIVIFDENDDNWLPSSINSSKIRFKFKACVKLPSGNCPFSFSIERSLFTSL